MNTEIEAALFDIGNVILPFDYSRAIRRLATKNQSGREPDLDAVLASRMALEAGKTSREEFLRVARREFGHTGTDAEFLEVWEDIFESSPEMNLLIEELAARIPLFLLSNISGIHRESIHRDFPIFSRFRGGVYSYEAGCLKPSSEIFTITIQSLDLNPQKTLYLDDMAENIATAREMGFQCIHYARSRHAEALRTIHALPGLSQPSARAKDGCGPSGSE